MTEKMLQQAEIDYTKAEGSWEGQPAVDLIVERGYSGFTVLLTFNQANGRLVDLGAYEG
jgi:hypothetical protein